MRIEHVKSHITKDHASGCWNWSAAIRKDGYGHLILGDKSKYPHRVVYEMERGPIPSGMHIDHLCRNKRCCNPEHLEVVTPQENTRRGLATKNRGACRHCGGPLDGMIKAKTCAGGVLRHCIPCRRKSNALAESRRRERIRAAKQERVV